MILGIDAGTSAVKLAVLDGDRICTTYYQSNCDTSAHTLQQALVRSGIRSLPITHVAVTGLNGSRCGADTLGLPRCTVSELDAIGCGGSFLSGKDDALVVNMGTGTTFVLARSGTYTHLGGTGIGGVPSWAWDGVFWGFTPRTSCFNWPMRGIWARWICALEICSRARRP